MRKGEHDSEREAGRSAVSLRFGACTLLRGRPAAAARFTLGFECPQELSGSPGETIQFDVYLTLTTSNNDFPDGVQGWSAIVGAEGAQVEAATLKGLRVSTIFDHDGDPSTPLIDPYELDLADATFNIAQRIDRLEEGAVVSAVVLHQMRKMELQPEGKERILKLTLKASVPEDGGCNVVSFQFLSGLCCGQPVNNVITFQGSSHSPQEVSCDVAICPSVFRRGDSNHDACVDISDAIHLLSYLFMSGGPPACQDASDVNYDGNVDIADATFLLTDLFSPHHGSLLPDPGPFRHPRRPRLRRRDLLPLSAHVMA